ncbi:low molecular weight protein-tyrosine-phosphatase [Prauserella halophila]|uniref:protein-tyrosine-phosphatase n=1 Tax=Prauserella halophila TaxID=185641 RepID=A0ABN1WJ05_9PSEU|nr:low molecular weight protein-tyrosine-phosphatase [Prauserella halophila]MCP2238419.1 protein-tyrosine phosphatase [Prauserella halophila]
MDQQQPDDTLHICFVCTGNICRSPMAALVFRRRLEDAGLADHVTVTSAGVGPWHAGEPADSRARATLRTAGYPDDHVAAQLDRRHNDADLFVVATKSHLRDVTAFTRDPERVVLLRTFDPSAPADAEVPDPYYGGDSGFTDVLTMIENAMPELISWVRARL